MRLQGAVKKVQVDEGARQAVARTRSMKFSEKISLYSSRALGLGGTAITASRKQRGADDDDGAFDLWEPVVVPARFRPRVVPRG